MSAVVFSTWQNEFVDNRSKSPDQAKESEKLGVDIRKYNNKEVNFGLTGEEAAAEADRCMRCYYISMVAV